MTEVVRNVRLYGKMGAKFGRCHRLAVNSPAEAVQALCSQLPGFEAYLYGSKEQGFGFAVFNGKKGLTEEELNFPSGITADIRIAPMPFGAKKGGVIQIIVGVVLIIIGAVLTYFGYGAYGVPLMKMGLAMVIGGVVQLLIPVPKMQNPKEKKEDPNYSFNGPVNTTAQGHPVPLLYGRLRVGSAVISAGITLKDENIVPLPGTPFGGGRFIDSVYDAINRT